MYTHTHTYIYIYMYSLFQCYIILHYTCDTLLTFVSIDNNSFFFFCWLILMLGQPIWSYFMLNRLGNYIYCMFKSTFLCNFLIFLLTVTVFVSISEIKLDNFYHLEYSNNWPHLHCYTHNVLVDMFFFRCFVLTLRAYIEPWTEPFI